MGFMQRTVLLVGLLAMSALPAAGRGESQAPGLIPVVFQSKWFPQAQFAGYWVAGGHPPGQAPSRHAPTESGRFFYAQEGLDVTILDGGSVNPTVQVGEGHADFGTDWLANMLVQRQARQLDIVHIAQIFQLPAYAFVAQRAAGINTMADLQGKQVGVWAFGNEFPATVCFRAQGLTDVRTTVYAFDPALVFPHRVDVASAMLYNELHQIIGLGFPLQQLRVMTAAGHACGVLEDFLFTTRALLQADNWKGTGLSGTELAQRFVRGTLKGWQWAIQHQAQAVQVVLDFCGTTCRGSGATQDPVTHQTWQMARVAEMVQPALLTEPSIQALFGLTATPAPVTIGCLNLQNYSRTVKLLEQIELIAAGTAETRQVVHFDILDAIGLQCPR
jgi:NitT/TauT family transport system substrate-binding protein